VDQHARARIAEDTEVAFDAVGDERTVGRPPGQGLAAECAPDQGLESIGD